MSEFLYLYHPVEPATWFYLSSLLTIGLYFKFSRLWSVRNLDLLLLILLAPGLLFVHYGRRLDENAARMSTAVASGLEQLEDGLVAGVADPATVDSRATTSPSVEGPKPRLEDTESSHESSLEQTQGRTDAAETSAVAPGSDALTTDVTKPQTVRTRGQRIQKYGYVWLFGMGMLLLIRLLADPTMVRRPLLEPNLSVGGLVFIGCSLFVFLMANVISRPVDVVMTVASDSQENNVDEIDNSRSNAEGPGYALLARMPWAARKTFAVLGHLTILVGMVLVGYRHFDSIVMGVGAAVLYLMLPYTALMTNEIKHVLPGACLVWAILCYRKPLAAGTFLGLAGGMTYYSLFLLPLWLSFYWARGLLRFSTGVLLALFVLSFVLFSSDDFLSNLRLMFGLIPPGMDGLRGLWDQNLGGWNTHYRIPVLTAFVAISCSMALWPAQKNLGTLLSCSAAVMVATQFWHGYGGGTYMAWYLPLLLLTIFRPNLEDRVAVMVLTEGWLPKRLGRSKFVSRAAQAVVGF